MTAGWMRFVCVTAALMTAALTATPATAEPKPTAKQLREELNRLRKDFDGAAAGYNANRVALAAAQRAERTATARLKSAESAHDAVREELVRLVALSYQSPPMNQTVPQDLQEPGSALHGAAILQQLAQTQQAIIGRYAAARQERQRAQEAATAKTRELRDRSDRLRAERQKADKLIDQITEKIDRLMVAPGVRRSDGSWTPELPSGPDNITPRTRLVRDQVKQRFKLPSIGCYRSLQDGGEHPQGRACDFMITTGGRLPSPAQATTGDALAAWAIKNANRLGIKYVIFNQRIWQGSGWKAMSNRGGITANHQDHVHISMR
ncbi:coiled-coil domain-containing protein [Nonomuraea purpurea]|uniref:Coiled-coil domain-containing protein n=1 Tax=Nonomuraea purpurea TaxID=1849276 RepID=A0ABV8GS41_9ACTN